MSIQRAVEGWCKNYNGYGCSDTCKSGVNYRQLAGEPEFGWASRLPCTSNEKSCVTCEKMIMPTVEEVAAWREHTMARLNNIGIARAAIIAEKKGSGKIECPICKNNLHFTVSSYNGHVHANCETKGCVSWME